LERLVYEEYHRKAVLELLDKNVKMLVEDIV